MEYELKLASGRVVTWEGKDGEDASWRYVDADRDATVVAWRKKKETNCILRVDVSRIRILEPGDPGWGDRKQS